MEQRKVAKGMGRRGRFKDSVIFFPRCYVKEIDILFLDNVKHHDANIAIVFRVRVYALVALKASVSHPSPK